jgi:hypothetical protein
MAVNLVSLVMQFLTPDMIRRIASALGLDRNNAQTAIGAGVPGLLAGLSGVALQPNGGQRLVDSAKQYTGTLGNFASMLGTGDQTSFVEKGSQMLASLLGGGSQTALAGALAKFAGLSQGASGSLLGMLAPVVMGTIAQQQGTNSLNMLVESPACLRARRTILPRRCLRDSAIYWAAQACSIRSAVRREQRPARAARRHGMPRPLRER